MNIGEKFYCSHCMKEIEDEECICPHCGYAPFQGHNAHTLEEGTLFQNGRYQIGAAIGSGGFGITYAAWDIVLDQPVAIKEYYPSNLCERDVSEDDSVIVNPGYEGLYQLGLLRFIREARILSTLQNLKNVVPVLEWFEANNTAYIVMKYISGVTLEKYVRANNIQPQKLLEMMKDIVDALILVHAQGIIHRDISPSNIMVQEDGTMILIDFGAASIEERRVQGEDRTVIYNNKYAPLEQYDEKSLQGPFTDVYALSATIYHLICGEPPQESASRKIGEILKSPRDRNINLKKYQDKAIMNGLILQPEKRPQSMAIFRSLLYNLPMPEEVISRRRFMLKVISSFAAMLVLFIILTVNFTCGFPLFPIGLRYSLRSDGLHVLGCITEKNKISIPESIAGIKVVEISEAAFQGLDSIIEAEISGNVKNIRRFAFNGCKNLRSVKLGNGVKSLFAQSFANCRNLQTVVTPSTLIEIDSEAFANPNERLVLIGDLNSRASELAEKIGLQYAIITTRDNENGVTLVKYGTKQKKVSIPDFFDGKPITKLESGTNEAVFPSDVQNIILPISLDMIGDYALYAVNISHIELPEGLKYIGCNALSQTFIEDITLPNSVEFVGDEAFAVCLYLQNVKLSENMKEIPVKCFERCRSLNLISIPEGVTEIKNRAFQNCRDISSITMPNSMRLIGDFAFANCTSLQSLYLPPLLNNMPISAIDGCSNLLNIIGYGGGSFAEYFCVKYKYKFFDLKNIDKNIIITPKGNLWIEDKIKSSDKIVLPSYSEHSKAITARQILKANALKSRIVILPEHIQIIKSGSFQNNLIIESVDCPSSLKEIENAAFNGCKNLFSIKIHEGLENIGIDAFKNCQNLSDIELPSSLKNISESAFENCIAIKQIHIPDSLTVLTRRVFSGTSIISVDIPSNIVKCHQAFEDCKSLRSASFSEGTRTIWGTFAGCSSLTTVLIPSSVNQISRSTFKDCINLRDVWIYSNNADLDYTSDVTKKDVELFSDSPNLTIHAYRGSSAHMYALTHGISFDVILTNDYIQEEHKIVTFKSPERIYTDEQIIAMITPVPNKNKYHYWGQFQYAMGYGFIDIAYKCLDAYEAAGDEYDKTWALSAKMFLAQSKEHGYPTGKSIAFFEGYKEHPTMKAGDIIVEIEGKAFRTEEEFDKLDKPSKTGSKLFTVLRADENGTLQKINLIVRKGDPLCATMAIIPLTFEER